MEIYESKLKLILGSIKNFLKFMRIKSWQGISILYEDRWIMKIQIIY